MIKHVTLKNFKAHRSASIALTNLTVFTGINGVGKSSFIQALLLLRQSHLDKRLPKQIILNHDKYVQLGKASDVFNIHTNEEDGIFVAMETTNVREIAITTEDRGDVGARSWLNVSVSKPDDWQTVAAEAIFAESKSFHYLQAERIRPQSNYKTNEYDVVELRSIGSVGEYTAHFIARHKDEIVCLPSLIDTTVASTNLLAQLDVWLSKISKGVRLVSNLDEAANSARIAYQFKYSDELTPEFSPTNVGFGLTYVLPVLVSVLSSKPGDLIIIENPESHLHPSGQSIIGQFLSLAAQDGLQIIIETHSDHIVHGVRIAARENIKNPTQGIEPDNVGIFYFDRNAAEHSTDIHSIRIDNNGKLYQIMPDGKKTAAMPKGFSDEWATNMRKLI
jgi:predicted ATPase